MRSKTKVIRPDPEKLREILKKSRRAQIIEMSKKTDAVPVYPPRFYPRITGLEGEAYGSN